MGLMICEDIVAVVFLIILSSITPENSFSIPYIVIGETAAIRGFFVAAEALIGGIGLILLGIVVARYVAPTDHKPPELVRTRV